MNKVILLSTIKEVRDRVPFNGGASTKIPEITSLFNQGYVDCVGITFGGEIMELTNIKITNAGHDFIVYADTLETEGVSIQHLSFADIEKYGRKYLLERLGLTRRETDANEN